MTRSVARIARLLAMAVTLLIAACSNELPLPELLARAESALAAGEQRAALVDARAVLRREPDNPQARRIVGEVELWAQNPAVAAESFERALRSSNDPRLLLLYAEALLRADDLDSLEALVTADHFAAVNDDPVYMAVLAEAQLGLGQVADARRTVARAELAAPDSLPVRLAAVKIAAQTGGDLTAAANASRAIVTDFPESDRAWSDLGMLYYQARNYPSAAEALQNSVDRNPNRHMEKMLLASALMQSGDLEQARQLVGKLTAAFPNATGSNLLQARLSLLEGNIDDALVSVNKVLAATPRHPDALLLAGIINSRAGNFETARRHLTAHLDMRPQQRDARLQLASVQVELGEPEAAASSARSILEEDPMNTKATRILAVALAMLGDQAGSMQAFGRALNLDPASASTAAAYGSRLAQGGDMESAIEQLRVARALEPESPVIISQLVAALLARGDEAGATAAASAYLDDYPDKPLAHTLAGSVARNTGDRGAAQRHFQDALTLDPESISANSGLAALAMDEGNTARAEDYLQRILATQPGHLPTLMRLAGVSEGSGDLAGMEARLQTAIDSNPQSLEPRVALARYRLNQKRYRDVVALLAAVEDGDGLAQARHELLAAAYLSLGEFASARLESQQLVELLPGSSGALVFRARAEMGLERFADAERSLRAAFELDDSPKVSEQLLALLLRVGKFAEAREILNEINADGLDAGQFKYAVGRIAQAEGKLDEAAAAFADSMAENPQAPTLVMRSNALWRLGEQAAAIRELRAWLEEHPNDTQILDHLAQLHLLIGEDEAALDLLQRLNILQPGSPGVLNNLAWASRSSNPAQSLRWIEQALGLAPDNSVFRDTQAMALLASGDADSALKINSALRNAHPEQPGLLLHRAEILAALDRKGEAQQILDKLIASGQVQEQARALKRRLQ